MLVRVGLRMSVTHLDKRGRCSEAHLGHRLPLASALRAAEAGARAGEGAKRGSAGGDGSLRHAVAVHLLHHAEGPTTCQWVNDLQVKGQMSK